MHNLEQLHIWKRSIELSVKVYAIVADFPGDEKYGITSQIKRAVVSIASNIAEGAGRNSTQEFIRFLSISNGSCYELETQIVIAQKLKLLVDAQEVLSDIHELQKMNYKLQEYLKNNINTLKDDPEFTYGSFQY